MLGRVARTAPLLCAALVGGSQLSACDSTEEPLAERVWVSAETSCVYASPVMVSSQGQELLLAAGVNGELALRDPATGVDVWSMQLTATPPADNIFMFATPGIVGRYALIGSAEVSSSPYDVYGFYLSVLDLETRQITDEFERITIEASVPEYAGAGTVDFDRRHAIMRSAIRHVDVPDRDLGLMYVSFGNGPSIQPFHGWMFEVDLDAWRRDGADAAFSSVFVTTAENDCLGDRPTSVCGGGIWNAAGPQIEFADDGSYELFVPTGNGRVDFDVGAYAHSVLRLGRGLEFDRACDESLCAPFDENALPRECLESCENIFVPRLEVGEAPLAPAEGFCDGLTFIECYGALDADLGANAPVIVQVPGGPRVIVQAGKDGALYLVDADHLGRMYQRLQITEFCGTPDDPCEAVWIGMFVTHPAVAVVDGDPVVILASQLADNTHPSGIHAVRLTMVDGEPRMQIHWQVPDQTTPEALEVFRYHPGRPIVTDLNGEPHVFVVETRRGFYGNVPGVDPPGRLWGVRVRDGEVVLRGDLTGAGQRYAVPLRVGDMLYLNSCDGRGEQQGRVEAWRLRDE